MGDLSQTSGKRNVYFPAAKRYLFASAVFATLKVSDTECGIGFGSDLLTQMNCSVDAFDKSAENIAYLRWNYRNPKITTHIADVEKIKFPDTDAAVSFDTIERLNNPLMFLSSLRNSSGLLIGSVPNQDVVPWTMKSYAKKHYTHQEIHDLLQEAGWRMNYLWSQNDSDVTRNPVGQMIVFGASVSGHNFPKIAI